VAGNPDPSARGEAEARNALQAFVPRLGEPPHTLLGVPADASHEVLRAAFLQLTKRFHPTKFARFAPDVVRLANEVFLTIKRAYDQLSNPPVVRASTPQPVRAPTPVPARAATPAPGVPVQAPRATTPRPTRATTPTPAPSARTIAAPRAPTTPGTGPLRPPPTARPATPAPVEPASAEDVAWGHALELMRRRLWSEARQAFHKLAVAAPHDKRYRAHMHLARARESIDGGRADEARAELQRALVLDPSLVAAKRALEDLPPEPSSGGLLGRFFKR